MWHGFGYGFMPGIFGGWGFIILIIVAFMIFRGRRGCGWGYYPAPSQEKPKALEILQERYARGEITKAEYEQMKKDLQS